VVVLVLLAASLEAAGCGSGRQNNGGGSAGGVAGAGGLGTAGAASSGGAGSAGRDGVLDPCTPAPDHTVSQSEARVEGPASVAVTSEGGFAAVWTDRRNAATPIGGQIAFARLDRAGMRVGADVLVNTGGIEGMKPEIVSAGTNFGLAYMTADSSPSPDRVHFARLDAAGALIGTPFDVVEASRDASLVWTGEQYGLAYIASLGTASNVFLARFDAAGAAIGPPLMLSTNGLLTTRPLIAWTGAAFVVSFQEGGDPLTSKGAAVLVDASGAKVGQVVLSEEATALAANDSGFAVAAAYSLWRFDSSGHGSQPATSVTGPPRNLVWTGKTYAFAYAFPVGTRGPIYLSTSNANADFLLEPVLVSASDTVVVDNGIDLVWTGSAYAIVWTDARAPSSAVHFAMACPP